LLDDPVRPSLIPRAVVFGCAGLTLSAVERDFFTAANPLGFCLFARNCRDPGQLYDLIEALRDSVDRDDAPILIDQEGGRVARLTPPHWRRIPAAARLAELPEAEEAVRLAMRLTADDLAALGITIDAAPVLDLPVPGADNVIGDRAYGAEPAKVATLGRAACEGLLAGGVLPIIKHIPGHGRATVDSHRDCPRVAAERELLDRTDFASFRALAAMPWAMTAHVVFAAIDPDEPATLSPRVVGEVIRGAIGFDGVLVSDDLSMGALGGGLGRRAEKAIAAGCDVALHCNGKPAEMEAVVERIPALSETAQARIARGEALRLGSRREFDRAAAEARFEELVGR
jgi:beta-N-acetylhexosaminidase